MGKSLLDQRCSIAQGSQGDVRGAAGMLLSVALPGGTRVLQAGPTTDFAGQRLQP